MLDEICEDIQKHLDLLMTDKWLKYPGGTEDRDVICMTILDYNCDYSHLRPHIRLTLVEELLYKVVGEYIIAIDSRRLTYGTYAQRQMAAARLREDADHYKELFRGLLNKEENSPMMTDVLPAMAEILDLRDKSLLTLEASSFVRKYPDVHVELLTSLIQSREDINGKEAKSIAEEAIDHARFHPKGDKEMIKLFGLCRLGRRALPALEETMQNMFATLVMTTTRAAH